MIIIARTIWSLIWLFTYQDMSSSAAHGTCTHNLSETKYYFLIKLFVWRMNTRKISLKRIVHFSLSKENFDIFVTRRAKSWIVRNFGTRQSPELSSLHSCSEVSMMEEHKKNSCNWNESLSNFKSNTFIFWYPTINYSFLLWED
jgi:hypothetical protein